MKHGALGPREGTLRVTWQTGDKIVINWDETLEEGLSGELGKGFGSQVLTRIVPMDLQGTANYNLEKTGLSYSVTAEPSRLRVTPQDD